MKRYVRIYIEGGSKGRTGDSDFRRGWNRFLQELDEIAKSNGFYSLRVVRGEGRQSTFKAFKNHKRSYPNDLCVLLVDSEASVPEGMSVWDVVARRNGDGWSRPVWATEQHLYLMVAFIETWLLADQDALKSFYKKDLDVSLLPTTDLENRSKAEVDRVLKQATRRCKSGPYKHGQAHEILEKVSPSKVKVLRHGRRLFEGLSNLIAEAGG